MRSCLFFFVFPLIRQLSVKAIVISPNPLYVLTYLRRWMICWCVRIKRLVPRPHFSLCEGCPKLLMNADLDSGAVNIERHKDNLSIQERFYNKGILQTIAVLAEYYELDQTQVFLKNFNIYNILCVIKVYFSYFRISKTSSQWCPTMPLFPGGLLVKGFIRKPPLPVRWPQFILEVLLLGKCSRFIVPGDIPISLLICGHT